MNRETIPQTDSIQELAEFWETHDLTEFENQLEGVEKSQFHRLNSGMGSRKGSYRRKSRKLSC